MRLVNLDLMSTVLNCLLTANDSSPDLKEGNESRNFNENYRVVFLHSPQQTNDHVCLKQCFHPDSM